MDEKNYKVIPYKGNRFVVVDNDGATLDNAQGYGYKTAQKAHAAWWYKNQPKKKQNAIKRKHRRQLTDDELDSEFQKCKSEQQQNADPSLKH